MIQRNVRTGYASCDAPSELPDVINELRLLIATRQYWVLAVNGVEGRITLRPAPPGPTLSSDILYNVVEQRMLTIPQNYDIVLSGFSFLCQSGNVIALDPAAGIDIQRLAGVLCAPGQYSSRTNSGIQGDDVINAFVAGLARPDPGPGMDEALYKSFGSRAGIILRRAAKPLTPPPKKVKVAR